MLRHLLFACIVLSMVQATTIDADTTVDITNVTIYGFGADFASDIFHKLTFDYSLEVQNNAEVIYIGIPVPGIICGYQNNNDESCSSMFHLFNENKAKIDFDRVASGRHLAEEMAGNNMQINENLVIDFAIAPAALSVPGVDDLQNFPIFVYGAAAFFNVPGVTKLAMTGKVLAKVFRGCHMLDEDDMALPSFEPTISPTHEPIWAPSTSPIQEATLHPTTIATNTTKPTKLPTTFAPTKRPTLSNVNCLPGSITRWDDPQILATNPMSIHHLLKAAGEIKVFVDSKSGIVTTAFKSACARFDEDFLKQIGNIEDNVWGGTNHEEVEGNYGRLRKVYDTPGSISLSIIQGILLQAGVHAVDLVMDENGRVLSPNTASLYSAFAEVGLNLGNDGTDPSRGQLILTTATGINSWPMALIGYFSARTQFTMANCKMRKLGLLSFVEFLVTKQGEDSTAFENGLAPLTKEAGLALLQLLREQLRCDGELVYEAPPPLPEISVYAEESLHDLLNTFLQSSDFSDFKISVLPPVTRVALREGWLCASGAVNCSERKDFIAVADENLSSFIISDARVSNTHKLFDMPYLAVATGFVHSFCEATSNCDYRYRTPLVLDVTTAANILDGRILNWNDSTIQALNPEKLLPNEPIIVIAGPKSSSYTLSFVQMVRNSYIPDFSFRLGDDKRRNTFLEAWWDVSLVKYSISFVVFNGTAVEGVEKISLKNDQGMVVSVSPESLEACARDTYDHQNNLFLLSNSMEQDCWPLTTAFTVFCANPMLHTVPAVLIDRMFTRSVRAGQGRTAVYTSGLGTLVDLQVGGYDLQQINFLSIENIMSLETGESVLRVHHELNLIPLGAIQAIYAVLGLELFIILVFALWTINNRNRKLINNSSPLFLLQVLLGAAVMACTVIPLSFQDDYLVPRAMTLKQLEVEDKFLNAACIANPILFSMGFFITFSAMFLKSWRLIRIFNNAKLKNLFLKDRQLMLYQTAVIAIVIVLNVLWAGIDPMVWVRFPRYENGDGMVVGSAGICYSRGGIVSAIPLIIGIVALVITGNYISYLGRRIPTEFNESKWTAMSMMMILESFVIAVPVLILSNNDPVAGFIIKSLVSLLVAGATVGLIFVPKIMLAYGIGEEKDTSNPWRFVRASDSSNTNNAKNNSKVVQQQDAMLTQIVSGSNNHDGRMMFSSNTLQQGTVPTFSGNSAVIAHKSFPAASASTSQALARVLQDDPTRRKFRRFLKTLKMEENVRFWDATMITKAEVNENKRYSGTRAVIQSFVMDNSPFQVNLSSATKDEILAAYNSDDKQKLKDPAFFDQAMAEMFDDLRQSDAFRAFLENDTFSTQNLA